jgi:ATP-binding cassette subfamily B protein
MTDKNKLGFAKLGFFGGMGFSNEKAPDIRIYRQDIFAKNICDKDDEHGRLGPKSQMVKYGWGPMGGYRALASSITQIFTGIVYLFVCLKAWGGAFGVGGAAQYIGAISGFSEGLSGVLGAMGELRTNTPFLRIAFEFLDLPNEMHKGNLEIKKQRSDKFEFEFKNVSFRYGNDAESPYALKNISMKFKNGQRLAVVGMNGSGKTTFIKLLCRLYDPTEGEILLNGVDIRKYDYNQYMVLFSVVFQDFNLLAYQLGQNVAAQKECDPKKAEKCLIESGFGDRLKEMSLDTFLYKDYDDKGVIISGGEAQKIAIARALYKEGEFLILDEPTAALDPVTEFDIYQRMNEIAGDKTAVFISHRLSSCRFCHDVVVFHEGEIVQRGSHDDLVADLEGKYYELWNAQAQYYVENA